MLFKAILLVVVVYLNGSDALRCRRCENALSLDDCTRSVDCDPDEECYTDELVTEQLAIVFNSGCRARDVCKSAASSGNPIGKKRDIDLSRRAGGSFIACSRCCDVNVTKGVECNTKMCGIKGSGTGAQQCYSCDSDITGGQGDVSKPTECGTYSNCQTDQVCGTQMFVLSSVQTHKYTCLNRKICTILTQRALEDLERCKDPVQVAAGACGNRKRTTGHQQCTACCGDPICNSGSCLDVLERLYKLWKGGVLDFKTLKTNASGVAPTTAPTAASTAPVG